MKHSYLFSIMFFFVTGLFFSCKKDKDSNPTPNTTTTTTTSTSNPLCEGNGSNTYFPLKMGNQWKYSGGFAGITASVIDTTNTSTGLEYEVKFKEGSFNDWTEYYTLHPNGDIYESAMSGSYLFVPANPEVGQEWPYAIGFDGVGKMKVISLAETVITSNCTYNNCLVLQGYDGSGDLITTYYFKKGVGKVQETSMSPNELLEITLK